MKCTENCIETISSKCIEYNLSQSAYDKLISIESELQKIEKYFNASTDGKSLGTGTNMIASIQKLIDKSIIIPIKTETSIFSIDLQELGINNSTSLNQEQLNKILVSEIVNLKKQLSGINTNNNY